MQQLCVLSEQSDLDSHLCIKFEGELADENINLIVIFSRLLGNQQTGFELWSKQITDLSSQK
jgi:hypothetical protein